MSKWTRRYLLLYHPISELEGQFLYMPPTATVVLSDSLIKCQGDRLSPGNFAWWYLFIVMHVPEDK